ncbi:MAG: cysteine desulfurase [Lachnospiraceae bacterium]|nr:cysteine desulfurase [Lachnospiraceae bacterium]
MECYLDNSATTRMDEEAAALMQKLMLSDYGNPSSLHRKGFEAEGYVRDAAKTFAGILWCDPSEICFTSGGTESNNAAIIGAALANKRRGNRIITTQLEHASVSSPVHFLTEQGFEASYLDADSRGSIDLSQLERLLSDDVILVSVMHVNNEIGSLLPIEEIGKLIRKKQSSCLFHVDDVQGFGKLSLIPKNACIDLLSASSHKLHGPKGAGLLYISSRTKLSPILFGGGQQKGRRSGTENVPGIAGFALAAGKMYGRLEENYKHMEALKDLLLSELQDLEGITRNGGDVPYIISLSVKGVRSEVLLHALEDRGVYVSAGSACSSNKPSVSAVLKAISVPEEALSSTIRISLCPGNTEEEIRYAAGCMREIIPRLRKFVRK